VKTYLASTLAAGYLLAALLGVDWNAVNTNVDRDEIESLPNVDGVEIESLLTDTVAAHLCQAIAT